MKRTAFALFALTLAIPASAQDLQLRPFVMFEAQRFAASQTFEATFGSATQSFWGGGLNVTQEDKFYLEVSASRFKKTGTRAFFSGGETFDLHIPQTITITPLEITAGYRFLPSTSRIRPSLGGGIGIYYYKQVSDFSTADENVDTQHAGAIVEGGVELRLHRWFGVAGDVHYSYVPGILGDAGFSKDVGEKNIGGVTARVKLIVGK